MNLAFDLSLSAISDKFTLFEVKLWSLIRDEFDLHAQIEEFRRVHLAPIEFRQESNERVGMESTRQSRRRSNGKPIISEKQTSGNLTSNMVSKFLGLQNRLQKCELYLWSLLDEKRALQTSIQDIQEENIRMAVKVEDNDNVKDNDEPASSIDFVLPIKNGPKMSKKSSRKYKVGLFICDICNRQFKRRDHIRLHMDHRHGACELIAFPTHLSILHNSKTFNICSFSAADTTFVCSVCGQVFRTLSKFKYHQLTHEEPKFSCDICSRKFINLGILKQHMKIHSGAYAMPPPCKICGKQMRTKALLTQHTAIHGERKHNCELCNKRFISQYMLQRHMRSHTGKAEWFT